MITWIVIGVYIVGWYICAPRFVSAVSDNGMPYCHSWNDHARGWCKSHCRSDCWRGDKISNNRKTITGILIAIIWPLGILVWDVKRRVKSKPSYADALASIDKYEKENKIGQYAGL